MKLDKLCDIIVNKSLYCGRREGGHQIWIMQADPTKNAGVAGGQLCCRAYQCRQGSGSVDKLPVVIRFQIKNLLEDYAKIGIFLKKYEMGTVYEEDELVHVSRAQVNGPQQAKGFLTADYKDINIEQAANLHKYLKNYQIYFYIEVDGAKVDPFALTNFQYLYLLFAQFPALDISCVIVNPREDQSLYYRLSHYFALLNTAPSYCPDGILGGRFYDHVWFYDGQASRRLQKKGIGGLQTFLPLIPICGKSRQELFKPMEQILSDQDMKDIATMGWRSQKRDAFDLLDGCKALLSQLYDKYPCLVEHNFSEQILAKMDQLTFFIFCYSAVDMSSAQATGSKEGEPLQETEERLRGYAGRLAAYGIGLRQIVENIVHYARHGIGALSLRRYEPENFKAFLDGRRIPQFPAQDCTYLVFEIADYAPLEGTGNLAETFKQRLPEDMRTPFQSITPADFFMTSPGGTDDRRKRELDAAWRDYRSSGENFTKHFGLYIFQQIIKDSNGLFFMESHSTHMEGPGERYISLSGAGDPDSRPVLPGTAYTVCFPLTALDPVQDSGIDKGNFNYSSLKYLEYQAVKLSLPFDEQYGSPDEKSRLVSTAASQLQTEFTKELRNGEEKVFQFDMGKMRKAVFGELWCKALLVALFPLKTRPRLVAFYNCSLQFINQFKEDMVAFFRGTEGCNPLSDSSVQISLFQENEIDALVFFPEDPEKTWYANEQLCRARGLPNQLAYPEQLAPQAAAVEVAPLEVICGSQEGQDGLTLFELYTQEKLANSIQERELGCKIEHTHMRLGSAVHICTFYEAELLFSNSLFYSRFAFLLLKALLPKLQQLPPTVEQLVLYGYSSYSELLLVELQMQLCRWAELARRTLRVEYLILEREAEQRGIDHTDRIRSSSGTSMEKLRQSPETKYIMVVPINSTLKTHNKMCFLLERAGIHLCGDEEAPDINLIGNFGIITVGPPGPGSKYWERDPGNRTIKPKVKALPVSTYFIYLEERYNEADTCEYCFPKDPLAETPLIEVNAASTIPNQSISLNEGAEENRPRLSWHDIKEEQDKLECLRPVLAYGHIERGENHFLYYFELEKLLIQQRDAIAKELQAFRDKHSGDWNDYNIIFCPLHFSNAGFVELINNEVFSGSALVIRVDVDKEFRTNAKAKFSYLKTLVSNLGLIGKDTIIRVHYVDDNILSGRTFHRSKSLMMSLLQMPETESRHKVSVRIFDTLFLLLNRNSKSSMESYYTSFFDGSKTKCFCFRELKISSLRTHGDSCVLCNLYRGAERMREMSSTKLLYDKWGEKKNRFRLRTLEDHRTAVQEGQSGQHGFYRLAATHTAGIVLSGAALYEKHTAFLCMADLMLEDLTSRTGDEDVRREFFFSYIKVLSRPFLIFHKTIKEAVLDLLLILMEHCLGSGMDGIKLSLEKLDAKRYLCEEPIYETLNSLVGQVDEIVRGHEVDYLKILMSQLTELKSNYVLRMEKMDAILRKMEAFIDEGEAGSQGKWAFYAFYLMQIKRLTSISSDTSKSLWLTREICRTYGADEERPIPRLVELTILENTRVLFDAASKLVDGLTLGRDDDPDTEKLIGELLETLCSIWQEEQGTITLNTLRAGETLADEQEWEYLVERLDVEKCAWNGKGWKDLTEEERVAPLVEQAQRWVRKRGDGPFSTDKFPNLLEEAFREDTYLYENLKGLMDILDYMEADQLTQKGAQLLLALTALRLHLRLCFPETESNRPLKMPVLEIYSRLTALLRYLLDADKLCIVTEMPAQYNVWKATIARSFDQLAEENGCTVRLLDRIDSEDHMEYLTLADGRLNGGWDREGSGISHQVDGKIIEALRTYKRLSPEEKKTGYLLQEMGPKTQFVLALGGFEGKGIYLYASFYRVDRIELLHRISCGLLFYPKLVGTVFDEKENRLLQELVQERYDLSIQQRAKAHSHTQDQELVDYYESAFAGASPDGSAAVPSEMYPGCTDSDVLCLVSDLIISDIYRSSLSEDFYLPERPTASMFLKKSLKGTWSKDGNCLTMWMRETKKQSHDLEPRAYVELRLQFPPDSKAIEEVFGSSEGLYSVNNMDRIRYLSGPVGRMRVPLFLLALSRNAIKDGIRQGQAVDVYFVKTAEHDLRIANKVSRTQVDDPDTMRIKYLDKPPANVEDGISLWSVSRYVQAVAAAYLDRRLEELKDGGDFCGKAERFKQLYQRLTSQKFALQIRRLSVSAGQGDNDEVLFCVDLPLLEEKYDSIEREEKDS